MMEIMIGALVGAAFGFLLGIGIAVTSRDGIWP